MSDDNWIMQVSFKNANQSMINVRGNTQEDLEVGLEAIGNITDQIAAVEALLGPLQPVGARVAAPASGAPTPPPAGAGPASPSAAAPNCEHNLPAKFVAGGVSTRTKRPYTAFWACAQDQAYQCKFRQDV